MQPIYPGELQSIYFSTVGEIESDIIGFKQEIFDHARINTIFIEIPLGKLRILCP